ncbi:acetyl-CoA carboxylase biotin carboxyl carrier protein [Taklimakanibacter lacteus]|uniref:acetyl-CoA carboxylase biotin carboxyl carrier protein n=1 Tax=Taklimakanibacter lacteus TaxID=2268456 RepID=UPI000E66CC75
MPAKKKSPPPRPQPDKAELGLIRNLADLLNETGLTEIELEQKGVRVRVSRGGTAVYTAAAPTPAPHVAPASAPAAVAAAQSPVTAVPADAVKSPMVGTVYRASQPGAPNFVEVGTEVKAGQTLLIIEAMKTMNQIPAPRAGKVTQIYVQNGSPVEYGEALVLIE